MKRSGVKLCIVNRFFPPDGAITGHAAQELAAEIQRRVAGIDIEVLTCSGRYRGGLREPLAAQFTVRRFRSVPALDVRGWRLVASIVDGIRLARAAAKSASIVVSLTDPPFLELWIGRALGHRRKSVLWIDWTMDVYPEALKAAGSLSEDHPIYRWMKGRLRRLLPDHYVCLGPAQAEAMALWRGRRPTTILPCGVIGDVPPAEAVPAWRKGSRRVFAYAGNLGEAHDAECLAHLVRCAPKADTSFVFAVYGSRSAKLRELVGPTDNVVWVDRLDHAELKHADVHVVSLQPSWTHICVPSKALSSICLGRPILFFGSPSSDVWAILKDGGWLADPGEEDFELKLQQVLDQIDDDEELHRKTHACRAVRNRLYEMSRNAFDELVLVIDAKVKAIAKQRMTVARNTSHLDPEGGRQQVDGVETRPSFRWSTRMRIGPGSAIPHAGEAAEAADSRP